MSATNITLENYVYTPAVPVAGSSPPPTINDQLWLMVLSGIATVEDLYGSAGESIYLSNAMVTDAVNAAIVQYGIPSPPNSQAALMVQHWSLFFAIDSTEGLSINSWVARRRPGVDATTQQPLVNIFDGADVEVVLDQKHRATMQLAYNYTLLGSIVFESPIQ